MRLRYTCSVASCNILPRSNFTCIFVRRQCFIISFQDLDTETAAKNFEAKLPLWSKTYDLPLELLKEVRELHLNPTKSAGPNDALLQEIMRVAVAAVDQHASRLSKLFLSQELRCLTGLLPVGTMHYHQNMVPSNSHVLAIIEPSDLPAFEVAFKAHQAEDRPAGILGTSGSHCVIFFLFVISSRVSQAKLPWLILPSLPKLWPMRSAHTAYLFLSRLRLLVLLTVTIVAAV